MVATVSFSDEPFLRDIRRSLPHPEYIPHAYDRPSGSPRKARKSGNTWNRLFTGRINVIENQNVNLVKCFRKLLKKRPCPCISVRLRKTTISLSFQICRMAASVALISVG